MIGRRTFLARTAAALGAGWAGTAAALAAGLPVPRLPQARPRIIDGLGEIRLEYPPELLDEILASGLRACAVTVGNPGLHGPGAFDSMREEIEAYEAHIDAHPERLSRVRAVVDVDRAASRGTLGLLYYTQNATPIQDDLGRLETLHRLGVRIVQLTYNTRNLLGDGCLERTNAGLSRFGVEAVERMNELGILVDVSHCGEATTLDGIRFSSRPVAVTHAGCRAVFDHPRNKTDEALRGLADRGGVIGIFQINPYLGPNERNTLEHYMDHIDHAVRVCGIEHVGVGSDREHRVIPDTPEERQKLVDELSRLRPDGRVVVPWPFFLSELNHPRRMETIAAALARRGRSSGEIDHILGDNFHRLFRETLG